MKPIGIGIIGAGRMGETHAAGFTALENVRVLAIADSNPERADQFAQKQNCTAYTDYRELLEREDIDAVSICLPHTLHYDCIVAAAEHHKHILCEKPLETTIEKLIGIHKACEKNEVILMPGHTHRFYPENRKVWNFINAGQLGKIIMIHDVINGLGLQPGCPMWMGNKELAGGGVLMNNGVHSIDRIRYWTGAEVESVYAKCGTYVHPIDVEDNGMMFLTMSDGSYATCEISWTMPRPGGSCLARILGTEGVIEVTAWSPKFRYATLGDSQWQEIEATGEGGYYAEIREFISSIREQHNPSVTIIDGVASVITILAAYESSQTGKVVNLKDFTQKYK